jgi:hypothetical protein
MTAEVALLNRAAVALAADSATTFTYWEGGEPKRRFFKGANKIFNISDRYPVGMMIYDSGNLDGMSWEVIAKAYREKRATSVHNNVMDYAKDFFDFVETDGHLFPRDYQEKQVISRVADAFIRVSFVIRSREKDQPPDEKKEMVKRNFETFRDNVHKDRFIEGIEQAYIDSHVGPFYDQVFKKVEDEDIYKNLDGAIDPKDIFDLAATVLFKVEYTTLPTTGLVIAGYGETDYFPQLCHYICYGLILGKLLCVHQLQDQTTISHDNISDIKDFAQAEMVKTFIFGASISALVRIDNFFDKALEAFIKRLKTDKLIAEDANVAEASTEAKDHFTTETSNYLSYEHSRPLRNVIGMLPVDELAELAETLISIESLKERVTRPTESVSGPIDVAVISKADGFIWIKRKHYFDPELNPRFFGRKTHARERQHG